MRAVRTEHHNNKVSMKRGEKEAISLRRRRLMKAIIRGVTLVSICILVGSSFYLWRSGLIENWLYSAEVTVEDSLVDAGLTVEQVMVTGHQQATLEKIEQAADINIGEPLLGLNISAIKMRVEKMRWVKRATISRKLPDAIIVNITEHEPAALWQVDNKLWVISDEGIKITDEQLAVFSELPMISGIGADLALGSLLSAVVEDNTLFDRVETASWVGGRRWDLILNNGIKIMLPEKELASAWKELAMLEQTEKLLARNILAVDFRIKGKTVVRLTPEEADRRRLMAKTAGKGEEI